ncbi:MAG: hypothetical protein R6X34_21520, partial [Chloroflexota bacterium]
MSTLPHSAWLDSVYHNSSASYVSNPGPKLDDTVTVRLRVDKTAPVRQVYVRTFPDGEQMVTPMTRLAGERP